MFCCLGPVRKRSTCHTFLEYEVNVLDTAFIGGLKYPPVGERLQKNFFPNNGPKQKFNFTVLLSVVTQPRKHTSLVNCYHSNQYMPCPKGKKGSIFKHDN